MCSNKLKMGIPKNLLNNFTEMLDQEDQTDVTFKIGDESILHAHKLILSAASRVFAIMISEKWCTNQKPIEIKNVDTNLFKMLIRIIYTNILPLEANDDKTIMDLYKIAHMYQVPDALQLLSSYILSECDSSNSIMFANVIWTCGENVQLQKHCEKIFAKNAMEILNSPEFLIAKPEVINAFYELDPLNVDSEDFLILKLDEYISKNKEQIPDIGKKLKTAIENMRLALIKKETIVKFETMEFNDVLVLRWNELILNNAPKLMQKPRQKWTLLSFLPVEMLQALSKKYNDDECTRRCISTSRRGWFVNKINDIDHHNTLLTVYDKYNHTNLGEYSEEDIIKVLDVFATHASCKKEFEIFSNYNHYILDQ